MFHKHPGSATIPPSGVKPDSRAEFSGTAEAMPYPNIYETRSRLNKLNAVCFLLLAALVSSAQTSKPGSEEARQVLALENAWNQAEVKADASGLNLLLGDEFVYTDVNGSFKNRAQWLADVQKEVLRYEQLGNQDQAVHIYGNAAVVTGIYRERVHLKGKSVVRRGRFTDTWVKQNGAWKCVASQATLVAP